MMKRASVVGVLVVLVIGAATCASFASMGFRVYGGYSMLSPSDYNDYMDWGADWWISRLGGSATVDELGSAIPFGVDFRYETDSGLMFSLGFTRFSGKAGYDWEDDWEWYALRTEDTISVTGGLGSVLYAMGGSSYRFYFGGGAGYYMVNLERTNPTEDLPPGWVAYDWKLKKNQFGFQGIAGFEYFLSQNITLGVELLYRALNIPEMTYTECDDPERVDQTWEQEMNLSGINMLFGLNIYT